jgi:hypothetical protein
MKIRLSDSSIHYTSIFLLFMLFVHVAIGDEFPLMIVGNHEHVFDLKADDRSRNDLKTTLLNALEQTIVSISDKPVSNIENSMRKQKDLKVVSRVLNEVRQSNSEEFERLFLWLNHRNYAIQLVVRGSLGQACKRSRLSLELCQKAIPEDRLIQGTELEWLVMLLYYNAVGTGEVEKFSDLLALEQQTIRMYESLELGCCPTDIGILSAICHFFMGSLGDSEIMCKRVVANSSTVSGNNLPVAHILLATICAKTNRFSESDAHFNFGRKIVASDCPLAFKVRFQAFEALYFDTVRLVDSCKENALSVSRIVGATANCDANYLESVMIVIPILERLELKEEAEKLRRWRAERFQF